MCDDEPPVTNKPGDHGNSGARWDPAAILRSRLEAARHHQAESVAALRSTMDDEQILADFGIDLGTIDNASGHGPDDTDDEADDEAEDADPDGEGTGL